jgi:hypothetical protein
MALIYCPDCSKRVSVNAPTCPGCGAPIAGVKLPPQKISVLRILGALILILAVTVFVFRATHPTLDGTVAKTSVSKLYSDFKEDEVNATASWGGKVVQINGKYVTSGVTLNKPWIIFQDENSPAGLNGVQCHFNDLSEANAIPRDKFVRIDGQIQSFMIYVQMINCQRAY